MGSFFVKGEETTGPDDWRQVLADPEKHWKTGYSAKALAYCWEEARGFPPEVLKVLSEIESPDPHGLQLYQGHVEHTTSITGRGKASQTDLLVKARSVRGPVIVAVEGKVDEGFDKTIWEWRPYSSKNKTTRIRGLCEKVDLVVEDVMQVRYQLLHRTASALIEAERFGARTAVMLVHSFSQTDEHLEDYQGFVELFGTAGDVDTVSCAGNKNGIDLYLAWVRGDKRYLLT